MDSPVWPVVRAGDEDLLLAEIPTVYAASRHEQPVTEAPAAVRAITLDDIMKCAEPVQPPKVHDTVANQRISRLIGKAIMPFSALRISFIDEE